MGDYVPCRISRLKQGFGFLIDLTTNQSAFFSGSDVQPKGAFSELREGDRVTATIVDGAPSPHAVDVRLVGDAS